MAETAHGRWWMAFACRLRPRRGPILRCLTAFYARAVRLRETGLSSRKVGGEMVILDLDRSRYLTVSGSGVFLLELLQQERDREELIQALVDSFEVDEHTARCDVDAFIADLSEAGLLSSQLRTERSSPESAGVDGRIV